MTSLGPELVVNGDFSVGTFVSSPPWTRTGTIEYYGFARWINDTTPESFLRQTITIYQGHTYRVYFEITYVSAPPDGTVSVFLGGSGIVLYSNVDVNIIHDADHVAGSNGILQFTIAGDPLETLAKLNIDNVSVKEIQDTVDFTVLDKYGNGLRDATVNCNYASGGGIGNQAFSVLTDSSGNITTQNVADGIDYNFHISLPGYDVGNISGGLE